MFILKPPICCHLCPLNTNKFTLNLQFLFLDFQQLALNINECVDSTEGLLLQCDQLLFGSTLSLQAGTAGYNVDATGHSLCKKLEIIRLYKNSYYHSLSHCFNTNFPGEPALAGFIEAKGDGSGVDNWSYKSCKAPDKSPPRTNQHPMFYTSDALPVVQPTMSKH